LVSKFTSQKMKGFVAKENADDLVALDLIEAGKVTPLIDRTFSLEHAPDALTYLLKVAAGRARSLSASAPTR
jgi:D-arabinose 1-dehydrogenase-like Zn-dependent alcohol dehydrogenase